MSKPIEEMTKEELIYAISDILNREEMDGSCRWCNAEEMPVNLAGETVDAEDADEYRMKHEPDCAVTYIEAVLSGSYEYVNEPAPPSNLTTQRPHPRNYRGQGRVNDDPNRKAESDPGQRLLHSP